MQQTDGGEAAVARPDGNDSNVAGRFVEHCHVHHASIAPQSQKS
jgi:hypothetical protein